MQVENAFGNKPYIWTKLKDDVDDTQDWDTLPDGEQVTNECVQPTELDRVPSQSLSSWQINLKS